MKSIFVAILLLNFCQPQAATLQISGVVPEPHVVTEQRDDHDHFFIHPRNHCQVFYAPIEKNHEPKWQAVHRPTQLKGSCHVKVVSL